MNKLTTNLIAGLLFSSQAVLALGIDYTNRSNATSTCELFAKDAYQAAENYNSGVVLDEMLEFMALAPVSHNQKHRAFQAIEFVWKNAIDNPILASTLAMGLCLKPKQVMAPLDQPWLTSPRTIKEIP